MDEPEQEEVYDLKRREVPVKLRAEDGTVQTYFLRDMDGTEREQFIGQMANLLKPDGDGKPSKPENAGKAYVELLCRTLYDPAGNLVPKVGCQKLPSTVQDALFKKAQKLCGLGKTAEADAKND